MAETEEVLNSLLIRGKEESEKASLKLNIQKTRIRACGPVTSRQIEEGKAEALTDFLRLHNHCGWWLKPWNQKTLAPWRRAMTNPDSVLKSRDVILLKKAHIVKAMIFPVVIYRFESWTIKKVECWRIDAFKLWCWRLLRVLWTARRSNQWILKKINSKYSLEQLMLKLQYFGHLIRRVASLEKTLMLGQTENKRRRGRQRMNG